MIPIADSWTVELDCAEDGHLTGRKAATLSQLNTAGLNVPKGFVITVSAYEYAVTNSQSAFVGSDRLPIPDLLKNIIRQEYQALVQFDEPVIVRSSMIGEDGEHSHAGQYDSIWNVRDEASLLSAIQQCWLSYHHTHASHYRQRIDCREKMNGIAVLVQVYLSANISGVLFTKDPLGSEALVLQAVAGNSHRLTSGLETGDIWHINPETHCATSSHDSSLLSQRQIAELCCMGQQIECQMGVPQDIEWAYLDGVLYVLQSRPITTRRHDSWSHIQLDGIWARVSLVESMPNVLSPFFSSTGLPALSAGYHRAAAKLGVVDALPTELFTEVNGYGYYRVKYPLFSRRRIGRFLIRHGHRLIQTIDQRWQSGLEEYAEIVSAMAQHSEPRTIPTSLQIVRDLFTALGEYYVAIQSGILPAAYMSEMLFAFLYRVFVPKSRQVEISVLFQGLDTQAWQIEKTLSIVVKSTTPDASISDISTEHLLFLHKRISHFTYTIDPIVAPLAETVEDLVRHISNRSHFTDVEAKQDLPFVPPIIHPVWNFARRYARLREDALLQLGLAIPPIRRIMKQIGSEFVKRGVLKTHEDIYFLTSHEIEIIAQSWQSADALVLSRQKEWKHRRTLNAPMYLPKLARQPGFHVARVAQQKGSGSAAEIRGFPVSSGVVTGKALIVHDPHDLHHLSSDTILITTAITPAWSAILDSFSGIVTEIGGSLSHSSIIVREYGIPAVMGAPNVTTAIVSGQMVTVDGTRGIVMLHGYV